ncbi:MAG: hypothetical protein HQK55_17650, partial [Deltaproteobacteria bacterium]|nr:hypothetical protein [Deltaproteobacteria bacterium]
SFLLQVFSTPRPGQPHEIFLKRLRPTQDAEIIGYCKAGNRTGLVVRALKSAGYRNVASLEGGFDEWVHQGNTVITFGVSSCWSVPPRSMRVRLWWSFTRTKSRERNKKMKGNGRKSLGWLEGTPGIT